MIPVYATSSRVSLSRSMLHSAVRSSRHIPVATQYDTSMSVDNATRTLMHGLQSIGLEVYCVRGSCRHLKVYARRNLLNHVSLPNGWCYDFVITPLPFSTRITVRMAYAPLAAAGLCIAAPIALV